MLMFVPFSFRASEIIFSLSLKLANLRTIVRLSFFPLLPTLCVLSTEIFSNSSFSLNKLCKISSVCSHVSFSSSAFHVGNMTYGHRETWYRSVSVFESSQVRILLARMEKLET